MFYRLNLTQGACTKCGGKKPPTQPTHNPDQDHIVSTGQNPADLSLLLPKLTLGFYLCFSTKRLPCLFLHFDILTVLQ